MSHKFEDTYIILFPYTLYICVLLHTDNNEIMPFICSFIEFVHFLYQKYFDYLKKCLNCPT